MWFSLCLSKVSPILVTGPRKVLQVVHEQKEMVCGRSDVEKIWEPWAKNCTKKAITFLWAPIMWHCSLNINIIKCMPLGSYCFYGVLVLVDSHSKDETERERKTLSCSLQQRYMPFSLHYRSFTKCYCHCYHHCSLKPFPVLQQDHSSVSKPVLILKHAYKLASLWTIARSRVTGEMKLQIWFFFSFIILFPSKEHGVLEFQIHL